MLNNFPVELVEEVMFSLPIFDLVSLIKTTRRMYGIAHAEKNPIRHRLSKRPRISLKISSMDQVDGKPLAKCTRTNPYRPLRENTYLSVYMMYTKENGRDVTYRPIYHELNFWRRCCKKHAVKETSTDNRTPQSIIKGIYDYKPGSCLNDINYVNFQFATRSEAVTTLCRFLDYLATYCVVGRFYVSIDHGSRMWYKLNSNFEKNSFSLRLKPSVDLYDLSFDPHRFFSSVLFKRGILELNYEDGVRAKDGLPDTSIFHYIPEKTRRFSMNGTASRIITDELLVEKFTDLTYLSLHNVCGLTEKGLVKLFYNIYESPQNMCGAIGFDPLPALPSFSFEDILSLIPTEAYEWLEGEEKGRRQVKKVMLTTKMGYRKRIEETRYEKEYDKYYYDLDIYKVTQ